MIILAYILSGLSLLLSALLLIGQPKFPISFWLMLLKLSAGALSPWWAVLGIVGAIIGGVGGAFWTVPMGILGAGIMIWYVRLCARDHTGFEDAFGEDWSDQILPEQTKHIVKKRWSWFIKMKTSEPVWERDVPFCTIPGMDC